MVCTTTIDTPLGKMRAAAENDALTGLWFIGQKYYPGQTAGWTESREHPALESLRVWLVDYFAGKRPEPDAQIAPSGTGFQKSVWDMLTQIPYGQTTTYGEIARRLGCKSARAVGSAVGHNPISILIPCHRVIGSNGSITGYAGGIDKKRALLRLEGGTIVPPRIVPPR